MIQVHHLNNSRSQRVLWCLEELGLDYEIVQHQRNPETNLAPESLLAVHPLGKAPVVVDEGRVLFESGAILDYLVRHHGRGRLAPKPGTPDELRYQTLLHYAEGSAMLPLMLKLYTGRLGEAGAPLQPRITDEIRNHFGFLDAELAERDWFVGDELSAVDIQLSFPIQACRMLHGLDEFPRLAAFREHILERPAYQRALERGGEYAFN